MSGSYWLSLIAVVGWLALAGWAEGHGGGKGYYYQQHSAAAQSSSPTQQPPALKNLPNAEAIQSPCDNPIDNDAADLCQQWRMAEAAEQMIKVSWGQLVLTFFSLFGLALTIWYTRHQATIAGQANTNALKAMKSDLRPWIKFSEVKIDRVELDEHGLSIVLDCGFQNVGRSPASRVLIGGKIHFSKAMVVPWGFLKECVNNIPKTPSPYENTIFPQGTDKDNVSFLFHRPDEQGPSYVYVFLGITYSFDEYPEVHKTCRLYQLTALKDDVIARLNPIDFGSASLANPVAIGFERANTGDYAD